MNLNRAYSALAAALMFLVTTTSSFALTPESAKKAGDAITKGAAYLISVQNEDGSWGTFRHPAIAAMCLMAIHNVDGVDKAKQATAIDKGMKFVLTYVQPDGSIYPAEQHKQTQGKESAFYPNYTTSIVLLCLATIDRPEDRPLMIKARKYLMSNQFLDQNMVDYGGIGYGRTQRADLSNGAWASEAIYYTEYLDKEPYTKDPNAQKKSSEMWAAMAEFVTKCQNLPETNTQAYVSKDPADRGGFFYRPNESKAGTKEVDGVSKLVSSGSMTYAGLKTMLYARLKKDDARVKGAMDYLMKNYTLTENPGMGMQGHFYYLFSMTKAFEAYNEDVIAGTDGKKHEWREDVIKQFVGMQKEDGSWTNVLGRFFESDPTLAGPYAIISLKIAAGKGDLKYR